MLEAGGGLLLGFLNRPAAFLLAGEMACAYWAVDIALGRESEPGPAAPRDAAALRS